MRLYFESHYLADALVYGITEEQFWNMNPRRVHIYMKAYLQKQKNDDAMLWLMGQYVKIAVSSSLDGAFNGRKATVKYVDRPLLQMNESRYEDGSKLTKEAKEEIYKNLINDLSGRQKNFERVHGKAVKE